MTSGGLAGLYILLVVLGLVLAILWIILPFAVFSMRDTLRKLLREHERTNELLRNQRDTPGRN